MAGSLSAAQVAAYERDGILFPIRVMSEADAGRAVSQLEVMEARWGGEDPEAGEPEAAYADAVVE